MNVIRISNENLSGVDRYKMTKSAQIKRMRDAAGTTLDIAEYLVYEDVNSLGEMQTIVSLMTPEREVFATNSGTFAHDFIDLLDCFAEDGGVKAVKVVSKTSKKGRTFITCDIAE